jgi:hypothetical protein
MRVRLFIKALFLYWVKELKLVVNLVLLVLLSFA